MTVNDDMPLGTIRDNQILFARVKFSNERKARVKLGITKPQYTVTLELLDINNQPMVQSADVIPALGEYMQLWAAVNDLATPTTPVQPTETNTPNNVVRLHDDS